MSPDRKWFSELYQPWSREPEARPETAEEYTIVADRSYVEIDMRFALDLAKIIPQDTTVADIGAGPANQDIMLAKIRPDLSFVLYDLSPEMLATASDKAEQAKVTDRMQFRHADMSQLTEADVVKGAFVISNTAIHSLDTHDQLITTFQGLALFDGLYYLRDLLHPAHAAKAKEWRSEVVRDEDLTPRERETFDASQHAGFSMEEFQRAVDVAGLHDRVTVYHPGPPNSRYVIISSNVLAA